MEDMKKRAQSLIDFIGKCPSPFHVIKMTADSLAAAGFTELSETKSWQLEKGGKYFIRRAGSSLIAFCLPDGDFSAFQLIASHTDSPVFKVKESPEMASEGLVTLNVEKYGGMLISPWFDRPLSVAGRVCVRTAEGVESRLVNIDRDLLMLPSLAIHMDRQANEGHAYKVQKEIRPIFGEEEAKGRFRELIAEAAGCSSEDLISQDLILYSRTPGRLWGADEEFFSAPRIDDLMCVYASTQAFLDSRTGSAVKALCLFDNEEVGSLTKQGASSMFLSDTLRRISLFCGKGEEEHMAAVNAGFMISADNGHAVHPNYPEKADPTNRPVMNGGVLIKYNAAQKYTTDAVSAGIFKEICRREEIPEQTYVNHSDVPGGSTLGNLSNAHVSLNTIDIGAAQLAMHSPYETAGVRDVTYLYRAMKAFFESRIKKDKDNYIIRAIK